MANDAFEKLKSSVSRGITTISVKTSSTLEKTKLKTHIDTLTKDIEKEFTSIGEEVYRKWIASDDDFSTLNARFELVQNKFNEISEINAQLLAIDERDNQILGTASAESAKPVACVCPACGASYDTVVKFCRKCGSKIGE